MYSLTRGQLTAQEILSALRRRKKLIVIPILIVTGLCTLGAFVLPRKYESSTTILVQRDEVLNPLVSYEMAVAMASEDMLKTFNEIVYSKTTVQTLIDSLRLSDYTSLSEEDRQELIKEVQKNITTERPGSSTFSMSYMDEDPLRAQKAVTLIANLFIKTILQVENQRNELAVDFFETKLEELRIRFEKSQQEMLANVRRHIQEMPGDGRMLSSNLEESERDIRNVDDQFKIYHQALQLLRKYPDPISSEEGRKTLYELQLMEIPYAGNLQQFMTKYDDYSRKYTPRYPEMQKLINQIKDLLVMMNSTLEKESDKLRNQRLDAEKRRSRTISDLQYSSVSQTEAGDKESNYDIYRNLYNEMKIKLEQARATRDLGRKQKDRFLIIDPPLVPTEPSKPNRLLIILGGFASSIIIGLVSAAFAELLDTTMRKKQDFEVYDKPIIAYIPDGRFQL